MTKESIISRLIKFVISYVLVIPTFMVSAPFFHIYDFITLSGFFAGRNSPEVHAKKVAQIQKQVLKWNQDGRKNRMCTGRKAWQTLSVHNITKRNLTQIDVDLNDVVEIDETNKVLTVEPGMMMGKLSSILLPLGWTVPVIPEFETLTIGGVICGTGIESTSNKYGLSSEVNISYDVVLANGDLVTCSKDEYSDLFYSIPWSHGTIGFLVAVKIPIIPASKYVKLEYFPTGSVQEAKKLLVAQGNQFVEGIMFAPKKIVVMYGNLVDEADQNKINNINRWFKPWFFKHVESFLDKSTSNSHIEYIPLRDYYHRHTRSFFWETKYVIPYGNALLFRYFIGWIYPLNFQLLKLFAPLRLWELYFVQNHVLQDFIVPMEKLESSIEFIHKHVEVYPLWLCPCKFFNKPGMVHSLGDGDEELFIDIGIYGNTPKITEFEPETSIREIEKFALENNGVQFLYADTYMTQPEFRKMFDMKLYDEVRAKYNCAEAFPDVYDKISRHARRIVP